MSKIIYIYEIQEQEAIMTLYVDNVKYHTERTYCHPCQHCSLHLNCCHPLKTLCHYIDYIAAHNDDDDRLIYWSKS